MHHFRHLIVRGLRPLTCRTSSSSSSSSSKPHEYYYKTDFSYSGVNLGEPMTSVQVEQKYQTLNPEQYSQQQFVNERMERVLLAEVKGGKVTLEKNEDTGIAKIEISNPEKANALTGTMMIEFADAVASLEKWKTGKAVIIHGDSDAGKFSGGIDVAFFSSPEPNMGSIISLFMHNILSRLQRLSLLSVAAIAGKAVGGGAEVVTACDLRVMEENAEVIFYHAKMGVSPGAGGGVRLVKLVGAHNALKLLTSCRPVSSQHAVQISLCDEIVPKDLDLVEYTHDWLKTYTFSPSPVVRAMKKVVIAGSELDLDHALSRERFIFTKLWGLGQPKKI